MNRLKFKDFKLFSIFSGARLCWIWLAFSLTACVNGSITPPGIRTAAPEMISDDQVNAVARQLYCPICQNVSLDVCPSQACADWRNLIRQKLAAGWSDTQIKTFFASQYGDQVLPEPPLSGVNWLAYILPAAFILLILAVAGTTINRMRQKTGPQKDHQDLPQNEKNDPYLSRLEEELRQRRGKR